MTALFFALTLLGSLACVRATFFNIKQDWWRFSQGLGMTCVGLIGWVVVKCFEQGI